MNQPLIRSGRASSHAPVHAPNAALLIDFDNVTLGIQGNLTKELRTLLNSDIIKGKVAVQRAYADWRRYPQYIVSLSESSIDLIFAPAFGSTKKNATDIRLAVDAIELVFTRPEIGTFILLSGDSDFSSLVLKLKEYGKYVIGVGIRESASDLLIQNCDEYYSYSDLAGLTKEAEIPSVARDPWELTREAVEQMARNGDVMRSDRLKQVMQQIDPNFDERDVGFNRFSKFVLEAAQKGLLHATKLDNGQYEVAPIAAPAGERKPQREGGREGAREGGEEPRRGRRGRRGRGGERGERTERAERAAPAEAAPAAEPARRGETGLTLARAFHLMTEALAGLGGPVPHESLRARMAAMLGREDPLLESSRFLKLLRQANDAEVADVRKIEEDQYEVAPPAGGTRPAARPTPEATRAPSPEAEAEASAAGVSEAEPAGREDAARSLRFRRGSRGPMRSSDVPMVGMVKVEPIPTAPTEAAEAAPPAEEPAAKPARKSTRTRAAKGTTRRKKATKSTAKAAASQAPETPAAEAAPAEPAPARKKRTRTRAKTKAAE